MNVSCPECQTIFRVDPAKVTSEKLRARCSVCGGIIAVGKGASWADAFADVPPRVATPRAVSPPLGARPTPAAPPQPNERLTPAPRPQPAPAATSPVEPPAPPTPQPSETVTVSDDAVRRTHEPLVPAPFVPPRIPELPVASPVAAAFSPPPLPTPPSVAAVDAPMGPEHTDGAPAALEPAVVAPSTADASPALSAAVPAPSIRPAALGAPLVGAATPVHPGRTTPAGRGPLTPRRLTPIGGNPSYHRGPTRPASPAFGAPLAAPAKPVAPPTLAPEKVAPAAVTTESAPRRPINPFLANDPNAKARRLARALVSDMIVYHPSKREEGLRNGTLKQLFREEIKKSYEEYVEQVGREFAEGTTHFQDALNDVLADGRRLF